MTTSTGIRTGSRMNNARIFIEKISARVFCQSEGKGGNPLTIFHVPDGTSSPTSILTAKQKSQLAQTCSWESVFVTKSTAPSEIISTSNSNLDNSSNNNNKPNKNVMSFYMPTGQEVAFCAHAAMGGSTVLASSSSSNVTNYDGSNGNSNNDNQDDAETIQFCINMDQSNSNLYRSIVHHPHNIVSLEMKDILWKEQSVGHPPALHRMIRTCHNITNISDLVPPRKNLFPTFVHTSIMGRPKTLIYVNSVDVINNVLHPPSSSEFYKSSCDALDQTTGLYFYTPIMQPDDDDDNSIPTFECRQFPRASGYPEDPATGVAAASLAISLSHNNRNHSYTPSTFRFHQGTAMGQPSFIMVESIKFKDNDNSMENNNHIHKENEEKSRMEDERETMEVSKNVKQHIVSFRLMGKVQVDRRETLEIDV